MDRSFRTHFSRFLGSDPERLLFTAHSHHCWPDVSAAAQKQCWQDAARFVDTKWEKIFGEVIPSARQHIARMLGLADPNTVVFAPNTHDFVIRLLSCLPSSKPFRLLTTDSEFHSFHRQVRRLEEADRAAVTRIATEPYDTFPRRFREAATAGVFDLVYVSHVFFNSGFIYQDLEALVRALPAEPLVVVDGYHGFCAVPTDFGALEQRCFYLAGGYKYAMSGEGACFLHCPPGYGQRPLVTGWYAGFTDLERARGDAPISYDAGGARFFGSTFDPVGLYRFNAVMDLLVELGVEVGDIHRRVRELQDQFLAGLPASAPTALRSAVLHPPAAATDRGHFLTFQTPAAADLFQGLREQNVLTDYRGDRLRFGFGLFHDADDVDRVLERLQRLG